MAVLIIIAADAEWAAASEILDSAEMRSTRPGSVIAMPGFHGVHLLRSGWGKVAAAASTQHAIDAVGPSRVVLIGTCGAVAGRRLPGDLIVAERTVMFDVQPLIGDVAADMRHYESRPDSIGARRVAEVVGGVVGAIGTGDRDLSAIEAARIVDELDVSAFDWEAAAVAWVAGANHVPWMVLKGVSDVIAPGEATAEARQEEYVAGTEVVMRRLLEVLPDVIGSAPSAAQPIACDIGRLSDADRSREQHLLAWFREAYVAAEWRGAEYAFAVASEPDVLRDVGELLAFERICCPFLTIRLTVDRGKTAEVTIAGPEGVREFVERTFARQ